MSQSSLARRMAILRSDFPAVDPGFWLPEDVGALTVSEATALSRLLVVVVVQSIF